MKTEQALARERVRAWREKNNLTPREMAQLVGVSFSTIYLIENGRQGIGKPVAQKLASVMGCGWANLLADRVVK